MKDQEGGGERVREERGVRCGGHGFFIPAGRLAGWRRG